MANLKGIIRSTLGLLSFAIIITTLTTCSAPGSGLGGGQGTISINFGDGARAAVSAWPPENIALSYITHTVTLTGEGGTQTHNIAKGQTTANISAASGNWDVKVESFINGYKFGSGTTRVNVAAGQSTACSVNMNKSYPNAGYYVASNSNEWIDAITEIRTKNGDYVIFVTGNISNVTGSTTNTFGLLFNGSITIIGDYKISLSGAGSLLTLFTGQSVTLIDTDLVGHNLNNISLVSVGLGTFIMEGNSSVSGNSTSSSGGGVNVSGGTLIMAGSASVFGNDALSVVGSGGGVNFSGSTFTMKDSASVYNNNCGVSGGGVNVSSGAFTMTGSASVYNNYGGLNGGGVTVSSGAFTMSGGTITGNTAAISAGGVYLSGGAFIMNGGTITGNTATMSFGGGVYVSSGTFTMNSPAVEGTTGSIKDNTAGMGNNDVNRTGGTINGTAITPYGTTYANGW